MFKEIKKLWNTGNYSSKRELVKAWCDRRNIDMNTSDKYTKNMICLIKRISENIIQGGDGRFWK